MIDLRYVKKLIEMVDESTVDSLEITSDKGVKIRISKSPSGRGMHVAPQPVLAPMVAAPAAVPARPASAEGAAAAEEPVKAPAKSAGTEVKSPMVGTFYGAPEPGAKPYVSVGSRVSKGQILCIIEAMKIMNEIESEVTGVVTEVLASDAQPVEYGQALFRIDPNG
ncbi:MAG TPA: acetyl-CoA carboxylase biotin carboxyl carrier protein [Gemmatimonadaceae bacterium]|nr:acetyl-CoA carboxylase biotin carboxyl carrier protein [Gemmatimonadaceae bacterium]